MAKKNDGVINLIDTFQEFKELKNIDRTTMINVLEESFRSVIAKTFGSDKLADIVTTYFPVIMLLTMPLLAMAVAFIQRKNRLPFIHHIIFSLHYTAFLELLFIAIYALYLVASPSMGVLLWILRLGAGSYLIMAFRKVYEPNSWVKAVVKALFTYLVYILNCLLVFSVVVIIACFMAALA